MPTTHHGLPDPPRAVLSRRASRPAQVHDVWVRVVVHIWRKTFVVGTCHERDVPGRNKTSKHAVTRDNRECLADVQAVEALMMVCRCPPVRSCFTYDLAVPCTECDSTSCHASGAGWRRIALFVNMLWRSNVPLCPEI